MAKTSTQQEPPVLYPWLKALGYGLLTIGSLLFSILCFLSLVGAPLGVLNLGFSTAPLINAIINIIGLTSLGVGSGIFSFWSLWKTSKKIHSIVVAKEIAVVKSRVDKERGRVLALKESLAQLDKDAEETAKVAEQHLRYLELSQLIATSILELMKDAKHLEAFAEISGIPGTSSKEVKALEPLWEEIRACIVALKKLSPDTRAVFYLGHEINPAELLSLLDILYKNQFEYIAFQEEQTQTKVLAIIGKFLQIAKNNPTPVMQLPSWLTEDPAHRALCRQINHINYDVLTRQHGRYVETQLLGLETEGGTQTYGTQLHMSNYIEKQIFPYIDGLDLLDERSDSASSAQKAITAFDKVMIQYSSKLKAVSTTNNRAAFSITRWEDYLLPGRIEKVCGQLSRWKFTEIDLREIEASTSDKQAEQTQKISVIVQIIAFLQHSNIALKIQLPEWFLDLQLESAQYVKDINAKADARESGQVILTGQPLMGGFQEDYVQAPAPGAVPGNGDLSIVLVPQPGPSNASLPSEGQRDSGLIAKIEGWLPKAAMQRLEAFLGVSGQSRQPDDQLLKARALLQVILFLLPDEKLEELIKKPLKDKKTVLKTALRFVIEIHPDKAGQQKSAETLAQQQMLEDCKIRDIYALCQEAYRESKPDQPSSEEEEQKLAMTPEEIFRNAVSLYCLRAAGFIKVKEKEIKQAQERAQQQVQQAQQQAQQAQEAQQQAQQQAEEEKKKGLRLAFYNTLSEDFDIKRMKQEVSLFEAASSAYKQVNHNEGKSAAKLKEEVVAHIRGNRERFARSVLHIDEYISDLESGAIDGGYLSLQALSEVLGHPIVVLRPSFNESNPVEIKIIGHQGEFKFEDAMLVIFDGQGHYDVCRVRGNEAFAGMVCEKAHLELKSATKIQAMFRGYVVRKEQRVDGEPKQDASVGMSFSQ